MNKIVYKRETLGSEPSKYQQEKKSKEIPLVVANERGGAQTIVLIMGLKGDTGATGRKKDRSEEKELGSSAKEGESPVAENRSAVLVSYLSTAGHVESRRNLGRPRSKAKYSTATDSA